VSYLPGKFARFRAAAAAVKGPFRWNVGAKRESLDTTSFESPVSASGVNVHCEHETGPLDTTFGVEGVLDTGVVNLFWPDALLTCDLLYRKDSPLGYQNVLADVLDFNPSTAVREVGRFSAQLQATGLVSPAA
jgi:hypothetical protein